jgi:hypothetical protein
VPVPSQESEQSCNCMLRVLNLTFFCDFLFLDFWTVTAVWYFWTVTAVWYLFVVQFIRTSFSMLKILKMKFSNCLVFKTTKHTIFVLIYLLTEIKLYLKDSTITHFYPNSWLYCLFYCINYNRNIYDSRVPRVLFTCNCNQFSLPFFFNLPTTMPLLILNQP